MSKEWVSRTHRKANRKSAIRKACQNATRSTVKRARRNSR